MTPQGVEITAQHSGSRASIEAARYDIALRPVHRTFADGTTVAWQRRDHGGIEMPMTLPDGTHYLVTHTADGRQRAVTLPEGGTHTMTLDASGRLVSMEKSGHTVVQQRWRSDGQLAAVEYETVALYPDYDADGVVTGVTLAAPATGPRLSQWRHVAYDEHGRVTAVSDSTGAQLQVAYDTTGAPTVLASARSRITIARDERGRIAEVTTSWGARQRNTYADEDGTLAMMHFSQGEHDTVIVLDHGRPTHIRRFDGGISTLSYDNGVPSGRQLKAISAPNGLQVQYGYDAAHCLAQVDIAETYRIAYHYDKQERLVGITRMPLGK